MKVRVEILDDEGKLIEVHEKDCGALMVGDMSRWRRARAFMWRLARLFADRGGKEERKNVPRS